MGNGCAAARGGGGRTADRGEGGRRCGRRGGENGDGTHADRELERERDPRLREAGVRGLPRSVRGRRARRAGGPRPPGPDPGRGARAGGLARHVLPGRAARLQRGRALRAARARAGRDLARRAALRRRGAVRRRPFPHGRGRTARGGELLLPQGERQGPRQQPGALQARLLPRGVRPGGRPAPRRPGARHRRLQHRPPRDRPRPAQGERREQRVPARGAAELDRWIEAGWTDTFRAFHPDEPGHYSWWAQRGGARARNVGWRIDYVLASPEAMERVRGAFIWPDEHGSDHCPVGVDLDVDLRNGEG